MKSKLKIREAVLIGESPVEKIEGSFKIGSEKVEVYIDSTEGGNMYFVKKGVLEDVVCGKLSFSLMNFNSNCSLVDLELEPLE